MRKLYQIVPTLPPAIDGLGDYALNLARQLRRFGIESHFIMGNLCWTELEIGEFNSSNYKILDGFSFSLVSPRTAKSLLSVLPRNSPILLHYSGYGYALRGCPRWLVAGLECWRNASSQPLVTMFHEVYPYNFGPPWTSSFWLSPLQKQLAIRLLQLSDRVLTSRENYAQLLYQLSSGRHEEIPILPVFSNIGEPEILPAWERRERIAIAFGHRNMRSRLYQNFLPTIAQICQVLEIKAIYDIGVPTGIELEGITDVTLIEMGVLGAEQISEKMRHAIAGFLSFPPPEYLAKSTIFAAYCAHGLLPILTQSKAIPVDGLEPGKHYWSFSDESETLSWEIGQAIAGHARSWYHDHSLPILAQVIVSLL